MTDRGALRLALSATVVVALGPAPARAEQPVRMDLVRNAAGWRIAAVTRLG